MADPVSTFAIISTAANTVGGIIGTMNQMQQNDSLRKEALYNADRLEEDAQRLYVERALAIEQQLDKGRKDIATGKNIMSANGNIGTSAQAQIIGSAKNLEDDLSAISYAYSNEAIKKKNEAKLQRYNADVYKRNRTNALIGGLLNTTAGIASSAIMANELGLFGGSPSVTGTGVGNITADGMYGLYGGWA